MPYRGDTYAENRSVCLAYPLPSFLEVKVLSKGVLKRERVRITALYPRPALAPAPSSVSLVTPPLSQEESVISRDQPSYLSPGTA